LSAGGEEIKILRLHPARARASAIRKMKYHMSPRRYIKCKPQAAAIKPRGAGGERERWMKEVMLQIRIPPFVCVQHAGFFSFQGRFSLACCTVKKIKRCNLEMSQFP
jgi:hypothetical protein